MRCVAVARNRAPALDAFRAGTHSRSVSTRGSFLASGAGRTRGANFTRTSSGASLTTGAFAAFFANRTRRARGPGISLDWEKRGCQIPVYSGAPPRPQSGPLRSSQSVSPTRSPRAMESPP